ncbi:MAG: glycosyltransferase [Saprospiraceae bacterium]|nr:glycosyltransferase [Saprospiraceae bacterium]
MTILFTVTNDLTYDQRMQRICGTLAENGHSVTLVGRMLPGSIPLETNTFTQKRLHCFFQKGFLFYAEYNLRLFFFLLFARYDAVCSIDLDTLCAGCMASLIRGKKRVFDAHEYFTEVPEVVHRPLVRFFWGLVAKLCLPFYQFAYTVGPALAKIFKEQYRISFEVVRNVPMPIKSVAISANKTPKIILYQGALNEGRGIEALLDAMEYLENVQLLLAGEGDLSKKLRQKAKELELGDRVVFLGFVKPADLPEITAKAWLGVNLLENRGQSYYYSLANKFFDCVQANVPVLTMDFPEYRALNAQHEVAILLSDLNVETIVQTVHKLLTDHSLHEKLRQNCELARQEWHWGSEQNRLLEVWKRVEFS